MDIKYEYKTPGQLIAALLNERGWTQSLLGSILGKDATTVSKLISDKLSVSAELALLLEESFSIPAERFLDIQKSFDLAKARYSITPNPKRASRAKLLSELPISEMVSRGWLKLQNTKDIDEIEGAVSKFFGVGRGDDVEVMSYAAKKTNAQESILPIQLAWLYRVGSIASQMLVKQFNKSKLNKLVEQLRPLLISPQEARKVPKLFSEYGIRLVFVEALKGSKIDGVCFWLDDRSPVIGLSLRFDRMDNFWFVLRHELEHVIQGHGKATPHFDIDYGNPSEASKIDAEEIAANEAASNFCIPRSKLDSYIARKAPLFQERDFLGFARLAGVHPCIAAGQVRYKTGRYELFNAHNEKIRDHVLPSAIADGWGDIAPI